MAKEQIYPYAVARIRMLERFLLTEKNFIQMAEARNIEDALKIMMENGYSDGLNNKNYEEALAQKLSTAYTNVSDLLSGETFMEVFLVKNDYHNLKVLMKEEISGVDGSEYLLGGGTVPKEVLKTAFLSKNYEKLPINMADAIGKAFEEYGKTMSGQMIDIVMDKQAFKDMKAAAEKSNNDFIKKYMEYLCDITNLKSFLRVKNMKKPFDMFISIFVEGGSLTLDVYRNAFGGDGNGFKMTQYGTLTENMAKGFTVFEKSCDDFIMAFIKDAK
ncbi:MAG: V-type ATPase subunit, partial [Anaerotignaceae bacterium]